MSEQARPSDFAVQLAAALDDNLHAPVAQLLEFEKALRDDPTDRATRQVYRDWLLEHGCEKRAAQVEEDLAGHEVHEYEGEVRPDGSYDWAGL
jgi:uncharacterized protein (TIGR02996 family)